MRLHSEEILVTTDQGNYRTYNMSHTNYYVPISTRSLNILFRINKLDSVKDVEQKSSGNYFFIEDDDKESSRRK